MLAWNHQITNGQSKQELIDRLAKQVEEQNSQMPVQVQSLCEEAIELIPLLGGDGPDDPATAYNIACFGNIQDVNAPPTQHGSSSFTIKAYNSYVTADYTTVRNGELEADAK